MDPDQLVSSGFTLFSKVDIKFSNVHSAFIRSTMVICANLMLCLLCILCIPTPLNNELFEVKNLVPS